MNDLISRQVAIDALCKRCDLVSDDEPCTEECNDIKILRLLPSAQPEQKKGKWIEDRLVSTGGGTYGVRRCSECEAYYQDVGYGWYYCPNCGAKMEV